MSKLPKSKRSIPFIEQMQLTECGLCCLAMISSYYKQNVSLGELRNLSGNGRDGTSLKQMKDLATHLGFKADWYKVKSIDISALNLPGIVFWDNKHYVLIEKVKSNNFYIVDPAKGKFKISSEEFEKFYSGYFLFCQPTESFKRKKGKNVWRAFLAQLLDKPKLVSGIVFTAIMLQLMTLGIPLIIQGVIDKVILPGKDNLLNIFLLSIIFLVVFQTSIKLIKGYFLVILNNYLDEKMMKRFFQHIMSLPYNFFQLRSFGDLIFRANSLRTIKNILSNQLIMGILEIGSLLIILIYMINQSIIMSIWVIFISLLNALLVICSKQKLYKRNQEEIAHSTEVQSFQTEILYGIFGVKVSGMEKEMYSTWKNKFEELLIAFKNKGNVMNYFDSINNFLRLIGPLIVLWLGAIFVFDGSITLGVLVAFHALSTQFFSTSSSVVNTVNSFILADSYLKRVQDIYDAKPEKNPDNPIKINKLKGCVLLDKVSLKYSSYHSYVLKDISLQIEEGQKIALVGQSGAGKSTLSRLILGLYEPTEGNIYYDGLNLNDIDKKSFRKMVGVVPQDVTLFNRSVKDNITLNKPEATMEEIIEAAKVAQIHDEIMLMPMKYDTIISELGMNISGGQRQRIAIARALVHKPSILVLDEATSSLDHVNEKRIDDYLSSINCTRVVISHRLNSLVNADKIIVLNEGKIVEIGTHEELIASSKFYSQYYINSGNTRQLMEA
ncbi:peptidase domain-containing ABC transporter [Bacillus swezeyi]|uniref:peptidase domain-containing ABC transporter n=1 Tax=Bacillus swezeyi TaxID=1925020 RepID=UPI002E210EEF|nr:peptidase domain-containing ABC transporter [Bacillus swezeyi]